MRTSSFLYLAVTAAIGIQSALAGPGALRRSPLSLPNPAKIVNLAKTGPLTNTGSSAGGDSGSKPGSKALADTLAALLTDSKSGPNTESKPDTNGSPDTLAALLSDSKSGPDTESKPDAESEPDTESKPDTNGSPDAAAAGVPLVGAGTFEQYIDHTRPEIGKFTQRYWYNATKWVAKGAPIIIGTPGLIDTTEQDIEVITGETFLTGMIADQVHGAVLIVEMRYMGESKPYQEYNATTLAYLTVDQVVADFVRITTELDLPFDPTGSTKSPGAPWFWVGATFAGTLGLWIEKLAPGTFFATHASSSSTQVIYDFWEFFVPVHRGMPQNCSADFRAIFDHIDKTLGDGTTATTEEQHNLKAMFGLEALEYAFDFAYAASQPIYKWLSVYNFGDYEGFYDMCDTIEDTGSVNQSPAGGVGLERALANYAAWFKDEFLPGTCNTTAIPEWSDPLGVECFNFHNKSSPLYVSRPDNTLDFALEWMACTWPVQQYKSGPPQDIGGPALFPRVITADIQQEQCGYYFPGGEGHVFASPGAAAEKAGCDFNEHTGGWDFVGTKRMWHTAGEFDGWRSASEFSDWRPGGPFQGSTKDENFATFFKGGFSGGDFYLWSGWFDLDTYISQGNIIQQFQEWTYEFYTKG